MSSPFAFTDRGDGLAQRLAETIGWCRSWAVVDLARSLRTESFRPWLLARDRDEVVAEIASRRRQRVIAEGLVGAAVTRHAELDGGRLLVFSPDLVATRPDGACAPEVESRGFFDAMCAPPWDTWAALGRDPTEEVESRATFVLAWVPPACIEIAHRGIWADEQTCLAWLHDSPLAAHPALAPYCPP